MSAASPVMRYTDPRFNLPAAKLLPTQHLVVEDETVLVTVLGSCVAACLHDPVLRIGGMNHFLLPDGDGGSDTNTRYGAHAMEVLINDLLHHGASRKRLEAKVFGGGNVLKGFTHTLIGSRNAEFVLRYLNAEHIPVTAQDLRGIHPRKVYFFPNTGKVMVQRLSHAHDAELIATETSVRARLSRRKMESEVELFLPPAGGG